MKKIYNTPKMNVIMINNSDIIATSDLTISNYGGNDQPSEEGSYGD